jgi:hypothetical protein
MREEEVEQQVVLRWENSAVEGVKIKIHLHLFKTSNHSSKQFPIAIGQLRGHLRTTRFFDH